MAAKRRYLLDADVFITAKNAIIVTNEERAPQSRREVKLPDACAQFDVTHTDTFRMLKDLAVRFEFGGRHRAS
ncbi:MAG TPA: DUF4411 family protein [Planctomycetota bacterium]|nr:DUF4411 family protein [Planctomycetota bacterium]